jgi:DNA repair exonuclease SbcCD ATPase subunit
MDTVQATPKSTTMKYNRSTIEQEDKEIEELEAARKGVEEKEEEVEILNPEEETFKKRYGDLRRHQQKTQEQHTDELRKLKAQIDGLTRKQVKLPKTDEELEKWTEQYPDVAKIVETIATKKAVEARKDVDEKLRYVDEMQNKVKVEKAENELEKLHPDFADIRADQAFHDWVEIQPKWIQSALYENDTDHLAAGKAIDLYKLETKRGSKKASATKDAARSVSNTKRSDEPTTPDKNGWSESKVQNLSATDWDKHEEAISESIKNGTFSYDLTGGAR